MRKFLCKLLALTMVLSLVSVPASAVEQAPSARSDNIAEHWFYDQLTTDGKAIYNALWDMYHRGMMEDGKTSYDLVDEGVVSQADIVNYLEGDSTLFSDFAAAKDAFDLEHPEVWYVDSSYLSFRITQGSDGRYHAYMGPGRSDNYYIAGVKNADDVQQKTAEINAIVDSIVAGAKANSSDTMDQSWGISTLANSLVGGAKTIAYSFGAGDADDSEEEDIGETPPAAGFIVDGAEKGDALVAEEPGPISPDLGDVQVPNADGKEGAGEPEGTFGPADSIGDEAENNDGSPNAETPGYPDFPDVQDPVDGEEGEGETDIPVSVAEEEGTSDGLPMYESGADIVSEDTPIYRQIKSVHEQITKRISYRFENDCKPGNAGYVRTVYGLVTHEGVCEAYARSMQMVLNRLGIPCVLVHGVQTSGTPEAHMWNAVQVSGKWYVVDATWDDPVGLDANGNIKVSSQNGLDGGETETYLLVGQDVTGANWQPSGYVSTGMTEFRYPEIALTSYGKGVLEKNGLKVEYEDGQMEGDASTVYHVSFNGDGLVNAAKKGYYFLVKMYDINADGSVDKFDDWYYSVHGLHVVQDSFDPNNDFRDRNDTNPYLGDTEEYLSYNVINCEYVEFAITTKAPPEWKTAMDLFTMGGYYEGDGSDILAETGLIFNLNGGYEQPPYVKNLSPGVNEPVYTGKTYTIHLEFTDPLYRPNEDSVDDAVEGKVNDAEEALNQGLTLDYEGTTYNWGVNTWQPHTFAGKPKLQDIRWVCETHGNHTGMYGIDADCRLTTLEYEFTPSEMWADDSINYEFFLTGLVGKKSNKFPQTWSYVFQNRFPFSTCPLISGYNWNLWGQPQFLDNPNDLNLEEMVVKGVNGNEESLAELTSRMHLDDVDMNGRLMLVVEDHNANRSSTEELANALGQKGNVDIPDDAIRSLFEIDFARICRETVVKTGQSVRLCVGFPEGFDASMAGIVFKAYHFTRNNKGEIVSVEEIPITVTPYGLVVTCQSFSPFEIVALDAGAIGEEPSTDKAVVILADEGGRFLRADGTVASGENGIVTLAKGQHVTLKIQADIGYAVSSVTFDGWEIPVADDGTVVVSYEDITNSPACFLNVTFISKAVLGADHVAGMTLMTPDTHVDKLSSDISDRLQNTPGAAPEGSVEAGSKPGDSGTTGSNPGSSGDTGDSGNTGSSGSSGGASGSGGSGSSSSSSGTSSKSKTNPSSGASTPSESSISFNDVAAGAYYYDAVLWAYEKGITGGTTATTFSPDNPCTRAQVMTFLWRAAGEPEPESSVNPFADVADGAYYSKAVLWAYEQGITGGTTPTTFAPNTTCTRAQVVTFLWRAKGKPESGAGNAFGDVAANSYYSDAVSWAVERGITGGTTATTFSPDNACTRAHVVTFLYRDLAS